MSHWKLSAIIAALVLGTALIATYFFIQSHIVSTINRALIYYVNERLLFAAHEASGGKASVNIGDISYHIFTNTALIQKVRITYRDSTHDGSTEIMLTVPAVTVSGVWPWEMLWGNGLHIGHIVINKPEFAFAANGNNESILEKDDVLNDTSAFSLPNIPNVDSLVSSFAALFLPNNLAPLTIDHIEVRDANGSYANAFGIERLSGMYEDVDLMVANVKIFSGRHSPDRVINNVSIHVGFLRHFSKQSTLLTTAGIDITLNSIDTVLTIDTFNYQNESSYTYKVSDISISFSKRIIAVDSFSITATQSDAKFFAVSDNGSDLFRMHGKGLELRNVDMPRLSDKQGLIVKSVTLDYGHLSVVSQKNSTAARKSRKHPPPMLYQVLRDLPFDVDIDSIGVRNLAILYEEHYSGVQTAAALDWKNVDATITGLSNIELRQRKMPLTITASGIFLNHAPMRATVIMPLNIDRYRLSATGMVSNLNITKLNTFLPIADKVKISDGYSETSTFEFELIGRKARGYVDTKYTNLVIDVLDESTRASTVLTDVTSWLINMIAIRSDNTGIAFKRGRIDYTMRKNAAIIQTIWFPIRDGLADVIGF
ncbi:MAG: hypothetical protein HYX66_05230 [Ignavibacteria bacterium]|nr:hypothetical protein [Ignavibacteria bacterium]